MWREEESAMEKNTHHPGSIKDPQHDGRLKENREAGRTMGTTPGSEARAKQHDQAPAESSHGRHEGSSHSGKVARGEQSRAAGAPHGDAGDDLKQREYRDEKGEVHHHTRTYQEQHGSKK
jgi:hypothetical protein